METPIVTCENLWILLTCQIEIMFYQEYYSFKKNDYDHQGFHVETEQWFMDLIGEFEQDFHNKFPTCYANHLFANHSTMNLINQAMNLADNENSGMDLIDGEVDLDANLAMEEFSDEKTVYAIGSKIEENEDEPIFLVIDDKLSNGLVLLKYIDDDESEETEKTLGDNILTQIRV